MSQETPRVASLLHAQSIMVHADIDIETLAKQEPVHARCLIFEAIKDVNKTLPESASEEQVLNAAAGTFRKGTTGRKLYTILSGLLTPTGHTYKPTLFLT